LHHGSSHKNLGIGILTILVLTMSLYSFLPTVHATRPALTLTPTSGTVGQTIVVNMTVVTAFDKFNIFFDSSRVTNGTALSTNYTTTFIVPQAIYGNHNVTLQEVHNATINYNATATFKVKASYAISPINLPTSPMQIQEGGSVQIEAQIFGGNASKTYNQTITVISPSPANSTYSMILRITANQSGTAENKPSSLFFPTNFTASGGNTNYTGTYSLRIYINATAYQESSFFVGLTNATSYHRFDWVNIKALSYTKPNEYGNITISSGTQPIFKTSKQATNGTIAYKWQVPANASIGTYTVSVKTLNLTGTVKQTPDVQTFALPGFPIKFVTLNLNMERVGDVNATVYQIDPFNSSKRSLAATGVTNSSGSVTFTSKIDRGNYTVNAYWNNVQVNETASIPILNTSSWNITCQLRRITLAGVDAKTHNYLPFLVFVLNSTYHTSSNLASNQSQRSPITNTSLTYSFGNELIAANYTVGAYRAGLLFNRTNLNMSRISPATPIVNFNITCPAYSLTIHAEDARQATLADYPIGIYQYTGGLYDNATTDSNGNATFTAAFGQYTIRLYDVTGSIVLNETVFTLVNSSSLLIRSSIFNANLSVRITGYLGLPLPNARVSLERLGVPIKNVTTNGNGVAFFENVIGGNSYLSVYVRGNSPAATANINVEGSTALALSLGTYVNVLGLIMDTSQFAVLLTFIIVIVAFAILLLVRRIQKTSATKKTQEKT